MRIRATAAAATLTGALALTALALPTAQAADAPAFDKPAAASVFGSHAKSAFAATAEAAEPTVSNVTINAGKEIVMGTATVKTINVSLTASHAAGIEDAYIDLWHGTDLDHVDGYLGPNEDAATCTASSATTSTCKLTITVDPQVDLYKNALSGAWHVTAAALAGDGSIYANDFYKNHYVKRYSKLTVNASPEPVRRGATLTVTGKLTRANWETGTYTGYGTQKIALQFRKAGTSTYTTIKTVTADSTGYVKTTTTSTTADGYWRLSYGGSATTSSVNATGDYVDVQ
ncbi:calcium-binding protein [Streptomyces sp. NPDC001530]|uniref:calcium-binding protein n=1 Tax=Streptomyces sp. NPDC001530 TaxID=3364582 RepID=UPI0036786200